MEPFFRKELTAFSSFHFHREAPLQMFDSVLNTPVTPGLSVRSSQTESLPLREPMIDLVDLIYLAIYIKLHQVNLEDALKFT